MALASVMADGSEIAQEAGMRALFSEVAHENAW